MTTPIGSILRTLLGTTLVLAVASPSIAQDKLTEAARKAWEQFQKGRPDEAVKTMEKAAAQAPGGAGRLALSRFRARMGGEENLAAALAAAQQAMQESASGAPALKSDVLANLAALELRLASSKDALAHAEQAVQAAATPEAALVLARVQVRRGRSAQALATAEKAGASGGAALRAKGFALLGLERPAEAADAFRKALEAEPARHQARVGLAAALLAQRKAAEAEAEARKAVDEKAGDPKDEEGFAVLGLAILATNPDDPATWTRAIGEAQTGATVLNPRNPAVKYAVGKIFEQKGDLVQAATHYQGALAVDPGFVQARAAMIQVLIWHKKPADAVALAKAGVTEDPESAEAQLLLGQVLLSTQAFAEALPALEAAAKLAPTQAEVHAALGSAYWRKGDLDKAAAAYKRALELRPDDTDLRLANAELLLGMKQPAAAAAEFKLVVEAPGYRDPIGWIKLGSAYRRMSPPKTDEAVAAYRKALELDARNATAALGIGHAYFAGKRYDEAIRAYQEAARLAPDMAADIHVAIAWCYVAKKDPDKARDHLVKAGRIEKELENAIYQLARGVDVKPPVGEPEGPGLAQFDQWIQSKTLSVRQRGIRGLCGLGREAVDSLVWVVANEADLELLALAVTCLGDLGPSARTAIPHLRQILRREVPLVATDEEIKNAPKLDALKRRAREALAKIER